MIITHKLTIDLARRGVPPRVDAMQGDTNTREVEISLTLNRSAWPVPPDVTAAVAFLKPDGTRGLYDKLPDGNPAASISDSTVTAILAPQMLTCAGTVLASVVFYDADMDTLATFPFEIIVEQNPAAGEQVSNNYYTLQNLDQVNQAYTELLERMDALEQGGSGISNEEKKVILTLFKNIAYTADMSAKIAELETLWTEHYTISYALTGAVTDNSTGAVVEGSSYSATISAETGYKLDGAKVKITMGRADITSTAYSGGEVNIPEVTGDVVITVVAVEIPHFTITNNLTGMVNSNSEKAVLEGDAYSATLTAASGYKMDGATVTVIMNGADVTSDVYANGVITIANATGNIVITAVAKEIPSYTITNVLDGVTNSNDATKVSEGDFYSATLSWAEGYTINNITITMGGVDVTADVYGEGKILITEVTGDVVITAEAALPPAVYVLPEPLALSTTPTDTGIALFAEKSPRNKAFAICVDLTTTALSGYKDVLKISACNLQYYGWEWRWHWYGSACTPRDGSGTTIKGNFTNCKLIAMKEAGTNLMTLYSNSFTDVQTTTPTAPIDSITTDTLILNANSDNTYAGTFNDFRIYERALTIDEIKAYFGEV